MAPNKAANALQMEQWAVWTNEKTGSHIHSANISEPIVHQVPRLPSGPQSRPEVLVRLGCCFIQPAHVPLGAEPGLTWQAGREQAQHCGLGQVGHWENIACQGECSHLPWRCLRPSLSLTMRCGSGTSCLCLGLGSITYWLGTLGKAFP